MSTISTEQPRAVPERRSALEQVLVREMWAALAIVVIWLAVLFAAVFGSDIINSSAGGDASTVPSAVAVALFASLATWPVAKYGFGRGRKDAD